ncbi:peptidase inhibitor family I36 protein [Amycolatopsis umgeniensis]|uniref:Membrane-associated PAP2 superfamily phosphatase n=1 Tax=Amycolatopsis umgeniensis TaxID=336628 RepID=A0A841AWR3_9PSEU|nr:peptidase inhibitor family I36 protein [Amycolatopsis umgeniensis]MBB5851333.1 membrane-associated PAP2 superfamily phosphatase [Amycolatopsis umgeniensis]
MSRKFRLTTLLAAGVALAATMVAPATAMAAPSCTSDLCLWSGINYTGTKSTAGYFDKNTHCYPDKHYNSAISRTGYSIRMYNGSSCNGPSFVLGPGKQVAKTQFVVHSFRRA